LYYIFKTFIADKLSAKLIERETQLKKLKAADEHYKEKMRLAERQRDEMIDGARQTTSALMRESELVAQAKADAIILQAKEESLAALDS